LTGPRISFWLLWSALGAGALLSAGCQSAPQRRGEAGGVQLYDVGGHVEMVVRDRRRDQQSKVGAGDTRSQETVFEESVKLETRGHVYHPNLMEFAAAGVFGLLQYQFEDEFDGRERSSSEDGEILEFDLSANLLQKKPYPGTVFARRQRALEARPFQSSLETTTTNFGLVWQYVDEKTPTSLQFSHTDVELDPLGSDEETGEQRNTSFRFETAYNVNERNAFSLVYEHLAVAEEPFDLSYDTDELTLGHRLDFGDRRHRLESELDLFRQRGTFDVERVRWRELLRLEHTDTLRSRFSFELQDRTQGTLAGVEPIGERSYRVDGVLEHELYESLISQLQLYAQTQRFDSGLDVDRFGAFADFDYRKDNPWGVLLANYRAGAQREERSGGSQFVEVLDERHTFVDPEPVDLSNPNVEAGSILITAEDRLTVYVAGRDYTVRVVGDRTELRRVPTGRIEDGQTVLIDYQFFVGGEFTLDTLTQNFSVRQDFKFGLSPYYRLRWQDQTLSPDEAAGALAEDITSQTVGVEYRWKSLRLLAEYQDHDSNITPFEAVRLGGDLTHRFKTGATGKVRARWSDVSYFPPNDRENQFFTIEGRYRHPLTQHLTVEGAVLYRNEDDSLSGRNEGVDADLSLEWLIRQTQLRITFEYGDFTNAFSENDHTALYVQVRRSF
jgi:hypothetical protein